VATIQKDVEKVGEAGLVSWPDIRRPRVSLK
jgi:hypothetical protein